MTNLKNNINTFLIDNSNDDELQIIGKVAKFPKNTKPSKAYAFMENVKIPKNRVWYILVQRQDDELSMVKYNRVAGVDLNKFLVQLKEYYSVTYSDNLQIIEAVSKLEVTGEEKFSVIKNISNIFIDTTPFITKITEDLLKILAD